MNLRTNTHHSKDRRARGLPATVAATVLLAAVPTLASAQGIDQYSPSKPPRAPSPADSPTTGGDGALDAAPSAAGSSSDAEVELESGSGGTTFSAEPESATSADAPAAGTAAPGGRDPARMLEADPLAVAANRPALALGAHASSGGVGALPIFAGAALLLIAAVLFARGRSGPRGEEGR